MSKKLESPPQAQEMKLDAVDGWGDAGVRKMLGPVADSPSSLDGLLFDTDMIAELESGGEIGVLETHGRQEVGLRFPHPAPEIRLHSPVAPS